jgi:hypothetical protein
METIRAMTPESPGFTIEQQKVNSTAVAATETMLNDVNQVGRALRKHMPSALLDRSRAELMERVRHVRNILEHWDENRDFWSTSKAIPSGKHPSARWYRQRFPDKTPWSLGWSNQDGSVVGGVVHVDELSRMLDELEAAVTTECCAY